MAAKLTLQDKSMSAKIVTVTSGKGGVGKTTAVANIAVALATAVEIGRAHV